MNILEQLLNQDAHVLFIAVLVIVILYDLLKMVITRNMKRDERKQDEVNRFREKK